MRSLTLLGAAAIAVTVTLFITAYTPGDDHPTASYEWQQVTAIESIVPMGMGRSSLVTSDEKGKVQDEPLRNFFSATGINFKNIADNDRSITAKIKAMTDDGWELTDVTTGSAVMGETGTDGLFMTRYLFRKSK